MCWHESMKRAHKGAMKRGLAPIFNYIAGSRMSFWDSMLNDSLQDKVSWADVSNQSLGVHGVGTKHFSLQMTLTQRSFNADDTPCKLDGGRELNNAVVETAI